MLDVRMTVEVAARLGKSTACIINPLRCGLGPRRFPGCPSTYKADELKTLPIRCFVLPVALSIWLLIRLPHDRCYGARN
jgi:hypothetical protein